MILLTYLSSLATTLRILLGNYRSDMIKIIKVDDVISEANKKGITAYRIAKETGLSTQTVYAYFSGQRVSVRTQERIINYINQN